MEETIANATVARGIIKGSLTRFINFLERNVTDIEDLEARKIKLEDYYKGFQQVQVQLELAIEAAKNEVLAASQEAEKALFDENYYKCYKLISKRFKELNPPLLPSTSASLPAQTTTAIQPCVTIVQSNSLQHLELRPYDGNPREWYSFQDSFLKLVHNDNNIPPVQKFYHLKNALRGELIPIIDNLEATEENYTIAWNLIKQRCNKPRKIIHSHLKELLELPEMTKLSIAKIRTLKEKAQMHVNALKALKEPVETWNSFLVFIVARKLDKTTRVAWEETLEDDQKPTFSELISFLSKKERGDIDDSPCQEPTIKNTNKSNHCTNYKSSNQRAHTFVSTAKDQCTYCNQDHKIYMCADFLRLSARERLAAAQERRLCINCLRNNHSTKKCLSSGCKHCSKKHNSLLHFYSSSNQTQPDVNKSSSNELNQNQSTPMVAHPVTNNEDVLLGTARIKILDKFNREHECRALLDGCSQINFISDKLASKLRLPQEQMELPVSGIGKRITKTNFKIKATIRSRVNKFERELTFVSLPSITHPLPAFPLNKVALNIPKNISLADPEFNKPADIDLLIGAALFYRLLENGQITLVEGKDLTLQKTLLGWIVAGDVPVNYWGSQPKICNLSTLENQLSRFWEIEELPRVKHLSGEERACEVFYSQTTRRDADGRYITRLPFNEQIKNVGNTYGMALQRYETLERKLSKNDSLKKKYHDFLRDYRDLGHMREVTDFDKQCEGYYIPHHGVPKGDNDIRVVYDASAVGPNRISLNKSLLVGPTIQDELIFIIMRFRLHNVVLAADIKQMYRQIKIDIADTKYQKIIWRENPNDKLRVFELTTVTQGTAIAPFLATRTLHQLAADEGGRFPLAAEYLENDFYVDDFLSGATSVEEALKIKSQLSDLLKRGGFELHKWASNKPEVVSHIVDHNIQNICLDNNSKKILGIHWDPHRDHIQYIVKPLSNGKRISKRTILSEIAQLFDPLGLLGPVIIIPKLIMQELWKLKLNWDETIPLELHTRWINFKRELIMLNDFRMSRQVMLSPASHIQLHGFCDASERAYGACIYLKSTMCNSSMVQIICAKSRVAPLKTTTVPRLELCAALLLSQLMQKIIEALKLTVDKIYMWSDSTITLHWIQTSPHCLKTFVANRVSEIQSISQNFKWMHIATEENPADALSRGQTPSDFIKNKLWLYGPAWLARDESEWNIMKVSNVEIPEQRCKITLVCANDQMQTKENSEYTGCIFARFSSITKLNRFVAFCHRAVVNKKSVNKITGNYSVDEINNAHFQIIRLVQAIHFSREIKGLKEGSNINSKSKIFALNPFLDQNGIVRVGGRLTHANISWSKKHPILLPRHDHITTLIIRNEHIKLWHAGVQATLSSIRQKYWPIDGKNNTRYILNKCVRCSRLNPKPPKYLMGSLPENRITQARPFENVGLDYCGPFFIKEKKFRNKQKIKAYVAVFVCFAVKAVHLELVTDLTTETCLEAIKRFISRRGKPTNIYSDNATNFVGAKNEMLQIQAFLLSNENTFAYFGQNEGIQWHFSPPRSPHFGGLWEAAVRSFKRHLYRTVGGTLFTYEQLNTCIIEIEAILNSRPLTPISADPNDLTVLTPAHFLIGDYVVSMPENNYQDVPVNQSSAWAHIQKIKQHFWKRWHKEYLNELRTRSKWHQGDGSEIKIGTLVTIKEDNVPPLLWSLGRIIAVHPGEDNIVRVATVKTQSGTYKRCTKKLAPLPIDVNQSVNII